jgi:hypothetical protein
MPPAPRGRSGAGGGLDGCKRGDAFEHLNLLVLLFFVFLNTLSRTFLYTKFVLGFKNWHLILVLLLNCCQIRFFTSLPVFPVLVGGRQGKAIGSETARREHNMDGKWCWHTFGGGCGCGRFPNKALKFIREESLFIYVNVKKKGQNNVKINQ